MPARGRSAYGGNPTPTVNQGTNPGSNDMRKTNSKKSSKKNCVKENNCYNGRVGCKSSIHENILSKAEGWSPRMEHPTAGEVT
jgi:hypothetical protein